MISVWLLYCKPYIEDSFVVAYDSCKTDDPTAGEEIWTRRALLSLYLFPHIDNQGRLHFDRKMEKSAADDLLKSLRVASGFEHRGFKWHGIVSILCF